MIDAVKRAHRSLFGYHNGELAHQYASAASMLHTESVLLQDQLFALGRDHLDPLAELIRIRQRKDSNGR